MLRNKNFLLLILLASLFSGVIGLSFAEQQVPTLDILKNPIPQPVNEFINSVKQVGINPPTKNTWLKFNEISPRVIFDKVDGWFYDTTGTKLVSVLRPVGNLLAWFFSTLADLIRWGLSLI